MTLLERIDSDIKTAMRGKETVRLGTLRMLKSDLNYHLIEKKLHAATDADVLAVVQRQVKKHKDSIEGFEKAGRNDLVEKEKAELAVLESYLPAQLSRNELEQLVKAAIAEVGAKTRAD